MISAHQMDELAAFIGDFGLVLILLGFCARFIWNGR